ncbi:hypothetical protein GFN49_005268 [Escherichia coli]|nr:hypothetical protein [Escherichia coli]EHK7357193.1 hypothetical protein [Escherichia coli]EIF6654467.1 hypothetical protein [Escherichia coli]EIG2749165.1 hypothetical protein [Escherichia coli]EIG9772091.1 hypothetical protein [Escherichia coli]
MEFKDLLKEIQEIAAHALHQRLNEVELESATKKYIDNMARNVRDAFTGLYSVSVTNNQNTEETAKRIASVMGFHVEEKYSKKEFWKTTKKLQSENCHLLRQSLLSMRKVIQMTQDYRSCSHYLKNSELS